MLAKRVAQLQESATLKLNALVNQLKSDGKAILNLTAGEPDFNPPEAAKAAVIEAVQKNLSRYTPTPGIPELRELIAGKTNRQQPSLPKTQGNEPWKGADVVVTNGGKQAIFNAVLALVERGDEAIVVAPYWLSYPEMVRAAEGKPVVIQTSVASHYKMTAAQLEQAITPKTKLVFIKH